MSAEQSLPPGFESLEPFVEFWAAPTLAERDLRRLDSSEAERTAFHSAAQDMIAPAIEHLDAMLLDRFDRKDERLMNLMLSLVHVSLAVELQGHDEAIHASGARKLPIVRGHADFAGGIDEGAPLAHPE